MSNLNERYKIILADTEEELDVIDINTITTRSDITVLNIMHDITYIKDGVYTVERFTNEQIRFIKK
jgi:hypothetical protein